MKTFEVRRMFFLEDLPKIEDFVFKIVVPDIPMFHVFNIDTNPNLPHRLPLPYLLSPNTEDFCLEAVDSSGEIIGIAINKEDVIFTNDSNTPKEWVQMVEFIKFNKDKSNINSLPGKTIELLIVGVHRDWRKHRVARRLVEKSMAVARAAGFTTMTVFCGNEYTARLVRSLGWRERYCLAYKHYPRLSGKDVVLQHYPPHNYIHIYVIEL